MLIAKGLGEAVPVWFSLALEGHFPAFVEGQRLEVWTRCW